LDRFKLLKLLEEVQRGEKSPDQACELIGTMPFEDLGFARVDHHRSLRDNFPEVVFCAGKTPEQVTAIFKSLAEKNHSVLGTRAERELYQTVLKELPGVKYNELGRVIYLQGDHEPPLGRVLLLSAGTADLPVAEEAAACLEVMGAAVDRAYDVGIAGLHRLLDVLPRINQAGVVIVVAGMEGALASVVGGLTRKPIIAVPTSVGYGASFGGLAALLAMLNSCASGVAVVNIDNGYGAAAMACAILGSKHG
jgi:NCAIR mutase (PurE)-related protein